MNDAARAKSSGFPALDDARAALAGMEEKPPHELSPWSGDITLEKAFQLIHALEFRVDELSRQIKGLQNV